MNKHNLRSMGHRVYSAICTLILLVYIFSGFQVVGAIDKDFEEVVPETTMEIIVEVMDPPPVKPTVPVETPKEDIVEETEPEVVETTMPTEPPVEYFDVPLSEDLQSYIFELCESYEVDSTIIVAMIFRESSFRAHIVGDHGNSLGLMQIQPKWFQERMTELGLTNLLDPYQNVTLGIDYVAELMSSGKSIEWVLMAYNGGRTYANAKAAEGVVTEYARTILEYSWMLKGE